MDLHQIRALEGVILSGIGIAGSIWAFLKWVWPHIKSGYHRLCIVFNTVEQMPAIIENLKTVETLGRQVNIIMKQVMPNGGSSLADSMKRQEAQLQDTAERANGIAHNVSLMTATMRAISNTNPRMATFETTADGLLSDCNKTYLRWTGRTLDEMLNWGWITTVHPEDRDNIRREWVQALYDVRQCIYKYRMLDDDGGSFPVEVTINPLPEGMNPCQKWVGVIYLEQKDDRERSLTRTV